MQESGGDDRGMHTGETDALVAQFGDLIALVGELSEEDFARPTRCPGWSVAELVAHCEGMLSVWPICIFRASSLGLDAISASTLIPYFLAILEGVSPALTVCVWAPEAAA